MFAAPETFVLFLHEKNQISRILPSDNAAPDVVLPISNNRNIRALAFDPRQRYVYWIDGRKTIKRAFENGSNVSVRGVIRWPSERLWVTSVLKQWSYHIHIQSHHILSEEIFYYWSLNFVLWIVLKTDMYLYEQYFQYISSIMHTVCITMYCGLVLVAFIDILPVVLENIAVLVVDYDISNTVVLKIP